MIAVDKNRHLLESVTFASIAPPLKAFLAGVVCALIAFSFGIIAAALAPVAVGLTRELYRHFTGRSANPENLAWMIAGAAAFVVCAKLI